ncbi:MAG: acetate--CoA ligase family protein [Chloroflexia bacterium]
MPDQGQAEGTVLLDAATAADLLRRYGVPMAAQRVVATAAEAVRAAAAIGFPVVLKASAPDLVHKSDVGAVRLGLRDGEAVAAAARELAERLPQLTGLLVQAQAAPGLEVIVGARRDPAFGPVVLVGLGGVWVEALGDVALRLAPVGREEAGEMLRELRGARLLDGYRGALPVDRAALAEVVVAVSRLIAAEPGVAELDLNPLIVRHDGVVAVDARVMVGAALPAPVAASAPLDAVRRMLNPRSIAVIGASTSRARQGGRLFHYLIKHGFGGALYAVNPGASEVQGKPSYPTIAALPEVPDLACIMVPAGAVAGVLEQCGAKGIGAAIVYTAGFGETGEAGQAEQERLLAVARAHNIRLCGPNTAGVVHAAAGTCAAFGMAFEVERMPPGEIAFLTQSGALGGSLLSRAWAQGIGFSHWVCTGNEADLTLSDYLAALVEDPATKVIAVFMEAARDPAGFLAACRRARELGKPVVVYKTGASEVGRRAVQSHTGSLAGDDAVYDAAFRATGVVRVHDLQSLVDAAVALAWQPLPRGPRIGVVSASGGACSVIADECARHGLELPALLEETERRVREIIPPFGASKNPIDVTMQITVKPGMVGQVAALLLAEEQIDAVLVMMTTNADPPALEVARGVAAAAAGSDKPVVVARTGAEFLAPDSIAFYQEARIPLFPMPDRAVRAIKAMVDYGTRRGDDVRV